MFTEKDLCQSLSLSCMFFGKERLTQVFSSAFCKIFINTFFYGTLLNDCFYFTAVPGFYTLQSYIAGNFQVVKYYQYGKKIIHIFQEFYRNRFLLHGCFFSFPLTIACFTKCLFRLFICLRTIDRQFCDQGNIRHSTLKLLKCDLIQTLNTFWNPSMQIFAAG